MKQAKKRDRGSLALNPPARGGGGFGALAVGALVFGALVLANWFFSRPIPLFSDAQGAVSRISITLWPILDSALYADLWGLGAEGPIAHFVDPTFFCVGFLFGALILGRLALIALRLGKTLRRSERVFFSLALGLIAESLLAMIFAATGTIDLLRSSSLFFSIVLFMQGLALPLILLWVNFLQCFKLDAKKRAWKREHGTPIPKEELQAVRKRSGRRFWRKIALRVPKSPVTIALLALCVLFIALYFFAGTVPPSEYDMLEYHAQGAREIIESGGIAFHPYNAYANMPQGAEMFLVWGDVFVMSGYSRLSLGPEQGLFLGTCCGKALLACFAPILALGLYTFCVRFFRSRRTGLLAGMVYLAFPGAFQTFACGLNDGVLALAAFGTFYALCLVFSKRQKMRWGIIAGLFAGFAVSIKYTGVVFVALPALGVLTGWLVFRFFSRKGTKARREERRECLSVGGIFLVIAAFVAAAMAVGGYWYWKNYALTGNPVWPLAYSIFGDATGTWTQEIAARWANAHSPHGFGLTALFAPLAAFFVSDSFASPFLLVFGVTGIWLVVRLLLKKNDSFGSDQRLRGEFNGVPQRGPSRQNGVSGMLAPSLPVGAVILVGAVFGYSLFFVALWLLATHRLLRFLDPLLPFFAILIAVGIAGVMKETRFRLVRGLIGALVIFCGYYALVLDATTSSDIFTPTEEIERDANRYGDWSASMARCEFLPTLDKRLLLVGDARAFAYRKPILYSTCWNRSPLVEALPESFLARRDQALAENRIVAFDFTPEEIAQIKTNLAAKKIGYILIDYSEIERFNSPGNYGLTDADLLRPELFQTLEKAGVWEKYRPKGYEEFSPRTKQKTEVYRVRSVES